MRALAPTSTPASVAGYVVARRRMATTCYRRLRLLRSTNAVLICPSQAANTWSTATFTPKTTHWRRR